MAYTAGIDLGTTFTAAAISRGDTVEMVTLGSNAASMPSALLLRADQTFLFGDSAIQRGSSEPDRMAREFKRRLGDPAPVLLGGAPFSSQRLTSQLLRWVIDRLTERFDEPPSALTVTHPANWGAYKLDHLRQAVREADLDGVDVQFISEPEAAAVHYAAQERIANGTVVAVYDLGGGTFDAAVLRKQGDGFEILGRPDGIEHLGGIDFDASLLALVDEGSDGALGRLDATDPNAVAALGRVRDECVRAKIALSDDTDVVVPVLLPSGSTTVRITRVEFEERIRPSLEASIAALHRALRSADLEVTDVDRVLLVGGSSRIPLVGQLVASALGRPVAIDADPKNAVALGAARVAGGLQAETPAPPAPAAAPSDTSTRVSEPNVPPPVAPPTTVTPAPDPPATEPEVSSQPASAAPVYPEVGAPSPATATQPNRGRLWMIGAVVAVVALIAGVVLTRPSDPADDRSALDPATGGGTGNPEAAGALDLTSISLPTSPTLTAVRQTGLVRCGVSAATDGIFALDRKFCAIVAGAILGDTRAVDLVSLTAGERFPALLSGEVDVVFRNTTATLSRSAEDVDFLTPTFHDAQVLATLGSSTTPDASSVICSMTGTTSELAVQRFLSDQSLPSANSGGVETADELRSGLIDGKCDFISADYSSILALDVGDFSLTPDVLTHEPLSPFVRAGDPVWRDLVDAAIQIPFLADQDAGQLFDLQDLFTLTGSTPDSVSVASDAGGYQEQLAEFRITDLRLNHQAAAGGIAFGQRVRSDQVGSALSGSSAASIPEAISRGTLRCAIVDTSDAAAFESICRAVAIGVIGSADVEVTRSAEPDVITALADGSADVAVGVERTIDLDLALGLDFVAPAGFGSRDDLTVRSVVIRDADGDHRETVKYSALAPIRAEQLDISPAAIDSTGSGDPNELDTFRGLGDFLPGGLRASFASDIVSEVGLFTPLFGADLGTADDIIERGGMSWSPPFR